MCLGLLCVPCYNCYQNTYSSKALFEKSKPPYWAVSNGENLRSLDWRTYKLEGLKDITPFRAVLEALPKESNIAAHIRPYEGESYICYFFQPGDGSEERDKFYEKLLSAPGWGVTCQWHSFEVGAEDADLPDSLMGVTEMDWPIIITGRCPDEQFLFDKWSYGVDEHQFTGTRTVYGEMLVPEKQRKWQNRPLGRGLIALVSKLKWKRKRSPWEYY